MSLFKVKAIPVVFKTAFCLIIPSGANAFLRDFQIIDDIANNDNFTIL